MLSGTTVNWYSLNEQLLRKIVLITSQPGFKMVPGLHLHILSIRQHKLFKELRVLLCLLTKERSHFQLNCSICVCASYLFMLRLGVIHFATVHGIILPRKVSNFAGAAAKYLRRPCGKHLTSEK
jgi:hypothetical protein